MKQDYKNDKLGEEVVHDFLCKNFYNRLNISCKSTLNCMECQKKGIDEIIGESYVDEKAAIEWATPKNGSKPLTTFTVELYTKNNSFHDNTGWLIDDRKLTNYYFFMWIWIDSEIKKNKLKYGRFVQSRWWENEKINKIHLCILDRNKLRNEIKQIYHENENKFKLFFSEVKLGKCGNVKVNNDVTLIHSMNVRNNNEAVNIKLNKKLLIRMSEYSGFIHS